MADNLPSSVDRQAAGAKLLLDAKITEFSAHVLAGNRPAAARARVEASAALESHFDLHQASIEAALRGGR